MKIAFSGTAYRRPPSLFISRLYEIVRTLTAAVLVAAIILTFFFRSATVDGSSMYPTLHDGDHLLISDFVTQYKRGDIVVIARSGKESLVKRIIAVGGDTIDIDFSTGDVTVNGVVLKEDYIAEPTHLQFDDGPAFPLTVPSGYVFVMGDNRNDSLDSRSATVGLISTERVLGRMLVDLNKREAE